MSPRRYHLPLALVVLALSGVFWIELTPAQDGAPAAAARSKWDGWVLTRQALPYAEYGAVAFSPDGRHMAGGSTHGEIDLWNAATGELIRTIRGLPPTLVRSVAFSPDGHRIVSGHSRAVAISDAETGRMLRTIPGGQFDAFRSVMFSPNGRWIAATAQRSYLWDAATGEPVVLGGKPFQGDKIVFTRQGDWMAFRDFSNQVHLWDVANSRLVHTLPSEPKTYVASVAISPDRKWIAVGNQRTIDLWDAATGRRIRTISGHDSEVAALAFSNDSRRILSGSRDQTARTWDVNDGRQLLTIQHPRDNFATGIEGVSFSPDDRLISVHDNRNIRFSDAGTGRLVRIQSVPSTQIAIAFASSSDGTRFAAADRNALQVMDASTFAPQFILGRLARPPMSATFSSDGSGLLSWVPNVEVNLWDTGDLQLARTLSGAVVMAAQSLDGKHAASAESDGVTLWDAATGKVVRTLTGLVQPVALAFSPDGRSLAAGGTDPNQCRTVESDVFWPPRMVTACDRRIKIWNIDSGDETSTLWLSGILKSLTFSPDGRRIAAVNFGDIHIWDIQTRNQRPKIFSRLGAMVAAGFSSDGSLIASATMNGSIELWDAGSGQLVRQLSGQREYSSTNSLAFSPDGRWLAVTGAGNAIELWDVPAGQLVRTLEGHEGQVTAASFSPDGRRIVSAGRDGTIRLWQAATGRLLVTLITFEGGSGYIALAADGFFAANEGAMRHLRLVRGFDVVPVPEDYKAAHMWQRTLDDIARSLH